MTHKLLELGHDVKNRRRVVGGLTTETHCGSWVELRRGRFVHVYDATQLDVELSYVIESL